MSGTVITGTDLVLKMNDVIVGHAKSHTISISGNIIDKSSKDDALWNVKGSGRLGWNAKCDGLVSYDDTLCNYESLYTAMIARTAVTIISVNTAGTPIKTYTGSAFISSLELTSPDDDNATFSVSFEGSGALTKS